MFAEDDSWGDPPPPAAAAAQPSHPESDVALEALLQQVELQPAAAAKPKSGKQRATPAPSPAPAAVEEAGTGGVELGFVTPCDDEWLQPQHFPSKVGGQPVWLDPLALPPAELLACGTCSRPMRFLLQLYCPRPELAHAFHRSLMLFCCGGRCLGASTGWRALRCNLSEATPHYRAQPDGSYTAHGREQLAAWPSPRPPLPQLWISVGMEGDWKGWLSWSDEGEEAKVAALLERYREEQRAEEKDAAAGGADDAAAAGGAAAAAAAAALDEGEAEAGGGGAAAEAEETETEEDEDEGFDAFQRRVSVWPEQALRFCRSGGPTERPLWLSGKRRAPPPPPCGRCGAARRFEFQVMPQLLCSLEAEEDLETLAAEAAAEAKGGGSPDALDWGTVAVYTCSASCAAPEGAASTYADEFVWHQPV